MLINIKLDKSFTQCFNSLLGQKDEKTQKLAVLNGFSDSQLNYTDFIDHFSSECTVADATIDSNANVSNKDVCCLETEISKPHLKLLSFNKIFIELNKKYGYPVAAEWLANEINGFFYLHDSYSSSLKPYCIMPQECCPFILNGKRIHCNMTDIYDLIDAPEQTDEANGVSYKRPDNLLVLDYDTNLKKIRYTRVTMVSKKSTDKDFYFVKSHNGCNIITTSDHKFITAEGEVESSSLEEEGNTLYCVDDSSQFTNSIYKYAGLDLTEELGWLVGMYLAEGYEQNGQLSICQSPDSSPAEYSRIIEILDKLGIPYNRYDTSNASFGSSKYIKRYVIRLKNGDNWWERKLKKLFKGRYCNEKRLCEDYCHFNDGFLKGVIAGLIDGDGTINLNSTCMIRMTSRTLINQIREIGLHFGVFFGSRLPYIQSQKAKIRQTKPMYSANVNMNRNRKFFLSLPSIKVRDKFTNFSYDEKFVRKNYVCKFGKIRVRDVEKTYKPSDVVFDLSTESHTFVCNNILVHNCFSYDIERLAKEGLFFISNFNNQPPKHLVTFTDFVGEFVSWVSNRTSGACGLASFLVYSYYFWRKDVEEGYFVKSPEYYRDQEFQRIVYKLNQPYLRVAQAAFTNFSIFDRSYLVELFGGKEFPDGSFMIDAVEDIIEYQKAFMRVVSDIRSMNMMTFPVLTFALLRGDDNKFVDEDFARWCCRHNMKWNDSNFFVSHDITSLSNCCRLVADIKNLGYFNSIGGSALEVGSVKVNTINLARLSYENDREGFFEALKDKTLLCCKTLDVIRHIIRRNSEKGLLPNYTSGIINFKNQYNTIGVIGIYEVLDKYGLVERDELGYVRYTDEALDFAKRLFDTIIAVKDAFCKDRDYMMNIEQIPAERAAAVLMEKDRLFHPSEKYELPLYGNQWIPLAVRTTLQEKAKVSALLDRFCNGGSIAHINLDAPVEDEETAWKLLNYVADCGVNYFAFCVRISACENNHAFYGDVCPHCGSPKVTTYQRIVGYFTPERSYSSVRKREFRLRDWFNVAGGR